MDSERRRLYLDGWPPQSGSLYRFEPRAEETVEATLIEDARLAFHAAAEPRPIRLAFVRGIARIEASLYEFAAGRYVRGIAGAIACGALAVDDSSLSARFEDDIRVARVVAWAAGGSATIPRAHDGRTWETVCAGDDRPKAPLELLLARLRSEEERLAIRLAADGTYALAYGPLRADLDAHGRVVGYVETHRDPLSGPEDHRTIPRLAAGQRTSLFRLRDGRYSTYVRIRGGPGKTSWAGIVRLELGAALETGAAAAAADSIAACVSRAEGALRRDCGKRRRAALGRLDVRLLQRLGPETMAEQAIRESIREVPVTN